MTTEIPASVMLAADEARTAYLRDVDPNDQIGALHTALVAAFDAFLSLRWKPDSLGDMRALFVGPFYVGGINSPNMGRGAGWSSWIMTCEYSRDLPNFTTEEEAKDALVKAVLEALRNET